MRASKPSSSAAAGLLPVWDEASLDGASGGAVRLATSSMLSDGGELLCSIWRLPDAKHSLAELGGVTATRVGDALATQACAAGLLLQLLPLLRLHACLAPAEPSAAPLYPPPAVAPRALLEAGGGDTPHAALTVGAHSSIPIPNPYSKTLTLTLTLTPILTFTVKPNSTLTLTLTLTPTPNPTPTLSVNRWARRCASWRRRSRRCCRALPSPRCEIGITACRHRRCARSPPPPPHGCCSCSRGSCGRKSYD